MAGKQAKVLSDNDVSDLLAFAGRSRNPTRNEVIVLLSAKAGLRAGEIANLTWDMVLDPRGHVGFTLELHNNAAKNGSGRVIPVHADLRRALIAEYHSYNACVRLCNRLCLHNLPPLNGSKFRL